MAITIGEAARRAGVSVRTLRHYDQIGLLAPSGETEGGYRLYDEPALMRLEQILYLKELGFALEDIRAMMTRPDDDAGLAMRRQRELLILKRRRLDGMIARLDRAIAGDTQTELEVFDMTEYNKHKDSRHAEEAKRRWAARPPTRRAGKRSAAVPTRSARACSGRRRKSSARLPTRGRLMRAMRACRRLWRAGRRLSRAATTHAARRCSPDWGRCTRRTSALQRTLTATARARRA